MTQPADHDAPDTDRVAAAFTDLQQQLVDRFECFEPTHRFHVDTWERSAGGGGDTRVLDDGIVFERAGVNYSHVFGDSLPTAASNRRPDLAGRSFTAFGVSVVAHPRNPFVPSAHANVRFFIATAPGEAPVWWFGGGFDLTPFYPFYADVLAWHRAAQKTCDDFDASLYPRFKQWCDDYFHLPHRDETRGIGGLFFDDFNELGFEASLSFAYAIGETFGRAFAGIAQRRRHTPYTEHERDFLCYRRGRYVEFNLVYDRGTLFGLQSKGRTESILMSMPPLAAWRYDYRPEPGGREELLARDYLRPRDWLDLDDGQIHP
ncbi:oxygen-dependent coproporphyrinogen oxidase [Salinisphaera sp. USBA-960]|uniref:oxygen-dependent coproporphyrinogen oxidase n=1 Tax=Salinisphaera orenii TaxID=856731 RepID=UPI000DBE1E91|nr:oxygen-dependent coproporphyrinogen oxidase [Salifodinibacter halophilus]NNC25967.1 oxygen-dependent coproporphyrinogen oxidase [Salifodinibacter halophilus]